MTRDLRDTVRDRARFGQFWLDENHKITKALLANRLKDVLPVDFDSPEKRLEAIKPRMDKINSQDIEAYVRHEEQDDALILNWLLLGVIDEAGYVSLRNKVQRADEYLANRSDMLIAAKEYYATKYLVAN